MEANKPVKMFIVAQRLFSSLLFKVPDYISNAKTNIEDLIDLHNH